MPLSELLLKCQIIAFGFLERSKWGTKQLTSWYILISVALYFINHMIQRHCGGVVIAQD
jgi:hypothetical protein